MLLASGRFAVSQTIIPEAQEHFLTPSAHRDTHIFGGLGLNNNQLSGPIPSQLGNLANLEELFLDINQLSGSIPSELGNLANLEFLILDINQLSGCVPAALLNVPSNDVSRLSLSSC